MAAITKTDFPLTGGSDRAAMNKFYEPNKPLGDILYVDSNNGTSTGPGFSPLNAYATVAQALAAVTANTDSVIYLLPGHNEGIGNAQLTWNKAGTKIIGIGEGTSRPRFDFDHANASIDITASGMTVQGIDLLPSVTVVAIGIDVNAAVTDTVLRDVKILKGEDGAGVDEFVLGVDIKAGCDRTTIENCNFHQHASSTGQTHQVKLTGASDQVVIRNCWMKCVGTAAVACIGGDTTLSTDILVENCYLTSDDEPGIELLTGTTGIFRNVWIFTNLATIAAATVADGVAHFNVRYVEVGNESDAAVKTASADD